MTDCSEAIRAERAKQMEPLLPWCTAEPCVRLPLKAVLVDQKNSFAYVTLAAIAEAFGAERNLEESAVAGRPANAEMIEGFRDGYDLNAPEPSANRSASYRHGFANGRDDVLHKRPRDTAENLRAQADAAMDADDAQ